MKSLLAYFLFTYLLIGSVKSQTVHLILVSDVEDARYGIMSKTDEASVLLLMERVKNVLDYDLKTTYLNQKNFSAVAVRNTLGTLSTRSDDIVFFYYTGSGFYTKRQRSKFPYLKLKGFLRRPVSLDEVGRLLQGKTSRLNIVLADCRETDQEFEVISASLIANEDLSALPIRKLFLEPCGVVKVSSAGKGQRAVVDTRTQMSLFTGQLMGSVGAFMRSGFRELDILNWNRLLSDAQSRVDGKLSIRQGQVRPLTAQNAIWEIKECTSAAQRNKYKMPSYQGSEDALGIGYLLEDLLTESNPTKQAELTNRIKGAFVDNAMVEITQSNGFPQSDSRYKSKQVRMSLDKYLEYVIANRTRIKDIGANAYRIKRTEDYTKIITMPLFEITR